MKKVNYKMSCNCGMLAENRVINFCTHVMSQNPKKYHFYCNNCFMRQFLRETCPYDDKCINAIILKEFSWENAYDYASNFSAIFGELKETEPDILVGEPIPIEDDSTIDTQDTENYFPHNVTSENQLPINHKLKKINIYVRISGEINYIIRNGDKWELSNVCSQEITIIVNEDKKSARFFISKYCFCFKSGNVILRKTDIQTLEKTSKITMNGMNAEGTNCLYYDEQIIYFVDGSITTNNVSNKKRIYWKFV